MKKHSSYAVQQGVELKKRENVKRFHVKHYNEKTKTLKGFQKCDFPKQESYTNCVC